MYVIIDIMIFHLNILFLQQPQGFLNILDIALLTLIHPQGDKPLFHLTGIHLW